MRSCSTASSGRKRKYDEVGSTEREKLSAENIIQGKDKNGKGKRRSISLSNAFFSAKSFDKYDNCFKLVRSDAADEQGINLEREAEERCLADGGGSTGITRGQVITGGERIRGKERLTWKAPMNEFLLHMKRFKSFLLKKSMVYKIRCLNHNSTWLSELSKGRGRGRRGGVNGRFLNDCLIVNPFPTYKEVVRLYYEQKYKEAYLKLSRISVYSFSSPGEEDILRDNYFKGKNYNLHFMIRSVVSIQKINFDCGKDIEQKKEKTKVQRKGKKNSISKRSSNEYFISADQKRDKIIDKGNKLRMYMQNVKKKKKEEVERERKKKRIFIVRHKFIRYENNVNRWCHKYLQNGTFAMKGTAKRGREKMKRSSCRRGGNVSDPYTHHSNVSTKSESLRRDNYGIVPRRRSVHKASGNLSEEEQKGRGKEKGDIDTETGKLSHRTDVPIGEKSDKKKHSSFLCEKERIRDTVRSRIKVDTNLLIFLKMLCLYRYAYSFGENKVLSLGGNISSKVHTKRSEANDLNFLPQKVSIGSALQREILMYIVQYLRKVQKEIKLDTHLCLLLSVVYYDLKKFHKSLLYVKKSIRRDYFNFVAWVFFNNLISIELFTGGSSRKSRMGELESESLRKTPQGSSRTYRSSYESICEEKKRFRENSRKLKKLCSHLFRNEYFQSGKGDFLDVAEHYSRYIYVNPLRNSGASFFFRNCYFVSRVFSEKEEERCQGGKRSRGDRSKKGNHSHRGSHSRKTKPRNRKTLLAFFERYQGYLKRYKFKRNLMSLFGFAHFCSLNCSLYKDSIKTYKHLKEILPNNFYVSCQLAKLYYYCGEAKKSMKCFDKMNRICNRNIILERSLLESCCVRYLQRREKKGRRGKKGVQTSDDGQSCVQVISAKKCKDMEMFLLPGYFSNGFIYVELLVNMLVCEKNLPVLLILLRDCERAARKCTGKNRNAKYDAKLCYIRGKYLSLCNHRKKSILCFKEGIQRNKYHVFSYMALAQEYFSCGNVNSSVGILTKAIILYFNNSSAWFSLAKCFEWKGNYRCSIFCYEQAINSQQSTIFYFHLSGIYWKKGDVNSYIDTLKKGWVFKKDPSFASMLFFIYLLKLKAQNRGSFFMGKETQEGNAPYPSKKGRSKETIFLFYEKNNECFRWCVKYLKCCLNKMKIMRRLNRMGRVSSLLKFEAEEVVTCGSLGKAQLDDNMKCDTYYKCDSNSFLKKLKKIFKRKTSYFCFIHFLRNSSTSLFEAIYYLAHYFFFHESFYNALKLFEVLWHAGGIYSEASFTMYRHTQRTLQRGWKKSDGKTR
ncbi:hypothetical protein C922_03836 [Plasmodium inui San Antonio 1]|uniref:Uncharacterized protein n=1 Tax=Plasmodium inui San Antonio 1 TaxID=1237626 RepID=W7A3D5_9APIC|nr:hypothetical protein C922_03836 [Plasmodium inui San Antonio 1]EUD65853.1 hypothetical protein C922_03836 [Plasmodium inui San Antonio 1]